MARGKSGRVVIEIDPKLKKTLYLELEKRDQTLKEWFVSEVSKLLCKTKGKKGNKDSK